MMRHSSRAQLKGTQLKHRTGQQEQLAAKQQGIADAEHTPTCLSATEMAVSTGVTYRPTYATAWLSSNLEPKRVMVNPPSVGALVQARAVITGEPRLPNWKADATFSADVCPLTRTVTGLIVGPLPHAGVTQVTAASSVHSVAVQRVGPTKATGWLSVSPKLCPCTTIRVPPSSAPVSGVTDCTYGAEYEKW